MEPQGTPNGETAPIEPVKNEAQKTVEQFEAELAQLKKDKMQAEMRASQLENEKKESDAEKETARLKKLEENNEFKTLYESEKQTRERLEQERLDKETKESLKLAKAEVLSGYSADVIELAETTGLDLIDDSDAAKEILKGKLDTIASKLKVEPKKVVGNNGIVINTPDDDTNKLMSQMRYSDPRTAREARQTVISKLPALEKMREIAGISK